MIQFNIKKFDAKGIATKVAQNAKKGQVILDEQVLKDANQYAPMDTGELVRSSQRMSQIGKGKIVYDTPYARRLYYNPQYTFSKDRNPRAQGLWFEAAKAAHLQDWLAILAKTMGGKPK